MTPTQEAAVAEMVRLGFEVIVDAGEIVRITKGADRRVVMPDGSQKRGHHVDLRDTSKGIKR